MLFSLVVELELGFDLVSGWWLVSAYTRICIIFHCHSILSTRLPSSNLYNWMLAYMDNICKLVGKKDRLLCPK